MFPVAQPFLSTFTDEVIYAAQQQLAAMSLSQQVAQRLIVGLTPEASTTQSQWKQFAQLGVGGFILFGRDFLPFADKTSADVSRFLTEIRQGFSEELPFPFLSIDQEGGLVEHLPPHLFPSLVSPMAVGARLDRNHAEGVKNPTEYAAEVYDLMAVYLSMLGFNTNFAPVLDVHGHPDNPVIGVRSFSENPERVIECARIVQERFEARGLMAVGKHAPGHGFSALDSHISKPTLPIELAEQQTFRWAVENNLPALMVAHATYPDWQGDDTLPASLSRAIVTKTLRNEWGYSGILISDDMYMGGVMEGRTPEEIAILACAAGLDMLIYRYGGETEQSVHQALCQAIESGQLSREEHETSVFRILLQKQAMKTAHALPDVDKVQKIMTPAAIESVSQYVVEGGVWTERLDESDAPFLDPEDCIGLIAPDWSTIPIYQHAASQGKTLETLLEEEGIFPVWSLSYPLYKNARSTICWPSEVSVPDTVVWITYHPFDASYVDDVLTRLGDWAEKQDSFRIILVQANLPTPKEKWASLTSVTVAFIRLWGYRMAHQRQLARLLVQ